MTREEAILHMILRREELKHSVGDLDEDIKAFDMAIEALEYNPCDKYIEEIDHLRKYIVKLETQIAEQQPCEDAISRSDAIRVTSGYCHWSNIPDELAKLPSVSVAVKGHCEDCDYFKQKFDEFTTVWGPVRKWSRYECIRLNAKTEKNGYCHMFEKRKEVEE